METSDEANHEGEDNTPDQVVGDVEEKVYLITEPITKDKVTIALTNLKNCKAQGPDGITGEVFTKKRV